MIPLKDCKHGGLYLIDSRNLRLGVFDENTAGFKGIREKFGTRFVFEEYHYDTGPPFGTVAPQKWLEDCPPGWKENNSELYSWLEAKEKQYSEVIQQ